MMSVTVFGVELMRKLSVLTFLSVDGVAQGPTQLDEDPSGDFQHSGWMADYFGDVMDLVNDNLMEEPVSFLFGRKTYEMFLPRQTAETESAHSSLFRRSEKLVVTSTMLTSDWENSEFLNTDAIEQIATVKQQVGPRIQVHGSLQLVQTLMAHDLVDEYRLITFPVVVGSGRKLFETGGPRTDFRLTRHTATESGVVLSVYQRT